MRFLSHEECESWLLSHGYPAGAGALHPPKHCAPGPHFRFRVPDDSGARIALARTLMDSVAVDGEVLVWLGSWDVWPSCQHMPLMTSLRSAFGEHRPLIDAPGFVAVPSDADDALSFVTLAILFTWDCSAFGVGTMFSASHDEWGCYSSEHAGRCEVVRRAMSQWASDGKVEPSDGAESR
jgi:hypothetical protein